MVLHRCRGTKEEVVDDYLFVCDGLDVGWPMRCMCQAEFDAKFHFIGVCAQELVQ